MEKVDSIELTYAQIRDPEFNPTLTKLINSKMKVKSAKKILKLAKAISSAQRKSDAVWSELAEKHLEPVKEGPGLQLKEVYTEAEKEQADREFSDFGRTQIVLENKKLTDQDLAGVELTPAEIMRLERLIED